MTAIIAVVGGGPAGLMAAQGLAEAGHQVHIYERKPSVGRKFLMAGRGGLNLTHSEPLPDFMARYGDAEDFLSPHINAFTPNDLRAWAQKFGQETFVGSSGRIFPKAMKASPLLRAWIAYLESLGVTIHRGHEWKGWSEDGAMLFTKAENSTVTIKPDATVLALGGASWPSLGSDGSWAEILWSSYLKQRFAGQPLKNITLSFGGHSVRGECIITERGIEGGAIYALSAPIRRALHAQSPQTLIINLRPDMPMEMLLQKLQRPRGRESFSTYLQKTLSLSPLSVTLLNETNKDASKLNAADCARYIKNVPVNVTAPFSLEKAISSAGGISLQSIDENMMLRALPGVFVAGEMLDWEAPTGGYLLQACLATGHAAARGALNWFITAKS
jgi:uncharacterized flavoprotein (TIGR03862 family)